MTQTLAAANSGSASNPAKRARKERALNWTSQDVSALIQAKRDMFDKDDKKVDGCDLMNPESTNQVRISIEVMRIGCSTSVRDATSCKTKWNQLILDYKEIANFYARIDNNRGSYWELTPTQYKADKLPRLFLEGSFFGHLFISGSVSAPPLLHLMCETCLLRRIEITYKVPMNQS